MTLAHRPFRVLKNLDSFHDWPLKYRHWSIDIAESEEHEVWVGTEGLRHVYPLLAKDELLKERFHSSMFYVKEFKRYYISEHGMRRALHRARRGAHETEVLRFLQWFDRNVSTVATKKRENIRRARENEPSAEQNPQAIRGPAGSQQVSRNPEAAAVSSRGREGGATHTEAGQTARVHRPEHLQPRLTWATWGCLQVTGVLRLLAAFWRGEKNLFLTVAASFLVLIIFKWLGSLLIPVDIDMTREYGRFLWTCLFLVVISVPVSVWMAVGLTRSTLRSFALPGGRLWATTVWFLVIPMCPLAGYSEFEHDIMKEWWDWVRGKYEPAWVYADRDLRRIVIRGEFKHGSAESLAAVLKANPKYTLVEISSPGGYVLEGFRMAQLLIDRKVDTVVMDVCASACTYLLAAGVERYIGPKAVLGFHRSGSRYLPISPIWSRTDYQIAKYYASRGTSDEFIKKALTPPMSGIWIAPDHEMYASGYATAPWSERKAKY